MSSWLTRLFKKEPPPPERPVAFGGIGYSIQWFIRQQSFGGFLLIFVTLIAVIWANSPFYEAYHHLWHEVEFGFTLAGSELKGELHAWINDGLMAIFFFIVGLEIKREVVSGELSSMSKAILPIGAAIGGMVVPAIIYALINYDNPENLSGWGVPMATDIAFALGLLSLLGDKVHPNLKIFLTALAIADDLGAILVIAFFYTETIDMQEILYAGIFMLILIGGNTLGIRKTAFYAIVGLGGVWLSFIYSGIHATIAGVLVALTIPARPKISGHEYITRMRKLGKRQQMERQKEIEMHSKEDLHILQEIKQLTKDASSPLQKLEHGLHPFSTFVILPLFALANAGIHFESNPIPLLGHPVAIGVILGLVAGKFLGISLFTQLMVRMKLAKLPDGVVWKQLYGAAMLAGIGFTMSIFISDLAFKDPELVTVAKLGIFIASIAAALLGMNWLRATARKET